MLPDRFNVLTVMRRYPLLTRSYDRMTKEPSEHSADDFIDTLAMLAEAAGYELKPLARASVSQVQHMEKAS